MNRSATIGWAFVLALGSIGVATHADAKQVGVPAAQPKVLLDVPDDWVVTNSGSTVEMRDPDKTSIVIVGLAKRNKADIDQWQKAATQKMFDFGITIDPKATSGHGTTAATAGSSVSGLPSVANSGAAPALSSSNAGAPATVFSGAPSLALPGTAPTATTALEDQQAAGQTLEQLTAPTVSAQPKLPFKAYVLYGAVLKGKPVDAEFLTFTLAKDTVFLLQQESGPTDSRAVAVMNSVRPAK